MNLCKVLVTTSIGLLVASAVSACGDDDENGAAGKFISDYCSIVSNCCEVWGATNDNGAQCNQVFGFYAMGNLDQAAADQCLANMRADLAAGRLCEGKPKTGDDPCDRALGQTQQQGGDTPAGGKCDSSTDCAIPAGGIALCDMLSNDGGTTEKYCQAVSPGKEGDGCIMTIYSNGSTLGYSVNEKLPNAVGCKAGEGLYCDSAEKKCKQLTPNGSACTYSAPCVEGSFCNGQVCTPDLKAGEACEKYTTTCETGLYCDEPTKKCAALKHIGDACTESAECTGGECKDDGTCGAGIAALAAMMMCKM